MRHDGWRLARIGALRSSSRLGRVSSRSLLALAVLACSRPERTEAPHPLELTADWRIGGADTGPASFGDIRSFGVDGAGRVYVLDAQAQEVRLFDSTGSFLRTLGRSGSGPGEFRGANGLGVDAQDHLWVYDPGNARVTEFDTSGTVRATHPVTIGSYGYIWFGGVDGAGRVYDRQPVPEGDSTVYRVLRMDFASGHTDTLALPPCEVPSPPPYTFPRGMMGVPFSGGAYEKIDAHGYIWCGDNRTVKVAQFPVGDSVPLRTYAASAEPAPVTPAERDSAIARVQSFMKTAGAGTPDYTLIPALKPLLLAVDLDDRSRLWARIQTRTGSEAILFDSNGAAISRFPLPSGIPPYLPLHIRGNHVYAVTQDSLDVAGVSRYLLH